MTWRSSRRARDEVISGDGHTTPTAIDTSMYVYNMYVQHLHLCTKIMTKENAGREGASKRASSRLAGKRKRQEDRQAASRECHRPSATGSAFQQDCGILPSE